MEPNDAVILEWRYTPVDFFEEPIYRWSEEYEIRMEGGKVAATIDPDYYGAGHRKRDELHAIVEGYFLARQRSNHTPFELSQGGMSRVYPDGRRDVTLVIPSAEQRQESDNIDLIVMDPDGNVIGDTKRERIDRELALGDAFSLLATDPILPKLLASYRAAVEDPEDELVHLEEIREALSTHFGKDAAAQKAIGVSSTHWSKLGRLTNNRELRQSRHRGQQLGPLRDATAEELAEARRLAYGLIDAYVEYMKRKVAGT